MNRRSLLALLAGLAVVAVIVIGTWQNIREGRAPGSQDIRPIAQLQHAPQAQGFINRVPDPAFYHDAAAERIANRPPQALGLIAAAESAQKYGGLTRSDFPAQAQGFLPADMPSAAEAPALTAEDFPAQARGFINQVPDPAFYSSAITVAPAPGAGRTLGWTLLAVGVVGFGMGLAIMLVALRVRRRRAAERAAA